MRVTWLIYVSAMTFGSFMWLTLLISDVIYLCGWHDSFMWVTCLIWCGRFVSPDRDAFIWVTWLMLMWITWLVHMRRITHLCEWHDSSGVGGLFHLIWIRMHMNASRIEWRYSFERCVTRCKYVTIKWVTALIWMSHWFVWVAWLIHMGAVTHMNDVTHSYEMCDSLEISHD